MDYEIVVVGAGPAGLSAALWAAELGMSHIVLEAADTLGGQLLQTYNPIENHLGFSFKNGKSLAEKFTDQVQEKDLNIRLGTTISSIDTFARTCSIEVGESANSLEYENIVFATGIRRRELSVPGEKEFRGKGILLSGKKQATEATGKTALVVGGGDAAFENALILSEHASKVYLVHRRPKFSARNEFVGAVKNCSNIEIITPCQVSSFKGKQFLSSATLKIDGLERQLAVDKAVIRIGVQPNSDLLEGLVELDKEGYVVVNSSGATSLENVFAIGDLAFPRSMTISTAIGSGATVVKTISSKKH